jgi:hypothetical protein
MNTHNHGTQKCLDLRDGLGGLGNLEILMSF